MSTSDELLGALLLQQARIDALDKQIGSYEKQKRDLDRQVEESRQRFIASTTWLFDAQPVGVCERGVLFEAHLPEGVLTARRSFVDWETPCEDTKFSCQLRKWDRPLVAGNVQLEVFRPNDLERVVAYAFHIGREHERLDWAQAVRDVVVAHFEQTAAQQREQVAYTERRLALVKELA